MTNLEWIKLLSKDQLAEFISISPGCNNWCKDNKPGCAWECKHNHGTDIIRKWLDKDITDCEMIE